jgi:hypothetical protein
MPATIKPRKENPKRSKKVRRKNQAEIRTELMPETVLADELGAESTEFKPKENVVDQAFKTPNDSDMQEEDVAQVVVKKIRDGIISEQSVEYVAGKGKPIIFAKIKMTTVLRGKRKNDGLIEGAYLLRIEVLDISRAARVEGLRLGPWQVDGMQLETGSVYLAEPIWTVFQPETLECTARIHIGDVDRKRLLDLPLHTQAMLPGAEPFSG